MMAISGVPLTALAYSTDEICYQPYNGSYTWYDGYEHRITDGFVEMTNGNDLSVLNEGDSTISVTSSVTGVTYPATIANNGQYSTISNNSSKTIYLLLNGTSITITATNPTASTLYTVTVKAGDNGSLSTDSAGTFTSQSYSNIERGTEISVDENTLDIGREETIEAIANDGYVFDSWSGVPSDGTITADTTITANFKATSYSKDITVSWKDGYSPKAGDTVATLKSNLVCSDTDNLTYEIGVYSVETEDDLADTDVLVGGKGYGVYCYVNLNDESSKFATTSPTGNEFVYYTGTIKILPVTFAANSCLVGDNKGAFIINSLADTNKNNVNKKNNKIQAFDCVTYPEFTIPASVDKSALASAITLGKTYTSKDYYSLITPLKDAVSLGEQVYDADYADQTDVDYAIEQIETAISNLRLKYFDVTIYKNGEDCGEASVQYGDILDCDADLEDGESVYKWVKSTNGVDTLLANNTNSASIVVTGDTNLMYYTETASTGSSTTRTVKYVDKSERVIDIKSAEVGTAVDTSVAEVPTVAFYDFAGWETVQGNSDCVGDLDVILKATYTVSKTEANKVTIIGLDGVTVQGNESYDAYYDEKVTLAGGDNYVFCDKDGNEISGINDSYIYAPHLNETIYVKAIDTKSSNASTRITGSFTANNYFTINAQYYLPEGFTAVEAGVVVSKTNADPTIGGDSCTKLVSSSQGDNHEYSISIKCSSTGTLNTKSYLIYKDASGNLNTVYSDANALSYGA